MQSSTCSKNPFNERVGSESTFVFDNPHELGTTNGMFHPYPDTENLPVGRLLVIRKLLSFAFAPLGSISLISGVLIQSARNRKGVQCIGHLLVMRFSGNGLADKENHAEYSDDNRMPLLLPTVLLFLFVVIYRTRNLSFCPIMKQYKLNFILGKFQQAFGKFLVGLRGDKVHCFKAETKNMR